MNAVSIENLDAGYGKSRVFNSLNLSIAPGEFTALLGPNGAGKSTLFRIITGLLKPWSGQINIFGKNIATIPARDRAKLIGVAPQEFKTPMPYTVEEIVAMGRTAATSPWHGLSRNDRLAMEKAMAYTDVMDFRERPLDELSGGEKQRVIIAMVLAQEPRLILLDEPTSHLDINHRIEIMQIIERLNTENGVTTLIISHDINLASEFCRRLVIMDHGSIAADGTNGETLREDILKKIYHCDMRVLRDVQTGSATVLPARRFARTASAAGPGAHLICGGGSGQELIRRLSLTGYRLSCGVLNELDTDAQVALAFGAETSLEKPFSPVSPTALENALRMSESADFVVISEVPFGPGNLKNLEIAETALRKGKRVIIINGQSERRDYTPDNQATSAIKHLTQNGAETKNSIAEFLQSLGQ